MRRAAAFANGDCLCGAKPFTNWRGSYVSNWTVADSCAEGCYPRYALNVLPGLGCFDVGRPVIGALGLFCLLIAGALVFLGASAFLMGVAVTLASLIGAIFTFGMSLLFLPIGVILLILGAGPLIAFLIWFVAFGITESVTYKTLNSAPAAEAASR